MAGALSNPPGPRGPFLLRAARARRDPAGFLAELARAHGDIVRFRLGRRVAFLLNDPELIHQVLVDRSQAYSKAAVTPATRRLIGDALFAGDGPAHDRQRRAIQPLFRHDRLDAVAETVVRLTAEASSGWRAGEVVDAAQAMNALSFRAMAANLFSMRTQEESAALHDALTGALRAFERTLHPLGALLDRLPTRETRSIAAATEDLERIVDRAIAERKARPGERRDVLDMLVELRFEDGGSGRLSDLELRHEAIDLIIASHETVAVALAWSLYELARHPEAQERVAEEALALGDRWARLEDATKLPASRAAFQEALRLHPPAWAYLRRARQDLVLGGYRVPRDSLVVLAPYVTQRDARFFPDPMAFDLERFGPAARSARPKLAYFPFGAGPRSCIGEPLAVAEGTLVLSTLLQRFKFEDTGQAVRERPVVTLLPAGPICLRVTPRM